LHRYIESFGAVDALESELHARYRLEEVGDFGGGEVGEVWVDFEGGDEDVAREEGFEVYEGEGEGGCVEDLHVPGLLSWEVVGVGLFIGGYGTYLRGHGEGAEFY